MSPPRSLGTPHVHHRLVGSTNEWARRLALEGAPHGTTVTADEQDAGRGRQGRAWTSPAGRALLASILVRDLGPAHGLLPLAAAVAVCEACEERAPVNCEIKWPNDVWIDGRKVAGILVEGRPQEGWAVIGVGVNVSTALEELPPELRESATSLRLAARPKRLRARALDLLPALTAVLARRLADPPDATVSAWSERDALRGERVAWQAGEGTAAGIDGDGALLVDTEGGRVALDAGEVHLARGPRVRDRDGG